MGHFLMFFCVFLILFLAIYLIIHLVLITYYRHNQKHEKKLELLGELYAKQIEEGLQKDNVIVEEYFATNKNNLNKFSRLRLFFTIPFLASIVFIAFHYHQFQDNHEASGFSFNHTGSLHYHQFQDNHEGVRCVLKMTTSSVFFSFFTALFVISIFSLIPLNSYNPFVLKNNINVASKASSALIRIKYSTGKLPAVMANNESGYEFRYFSKQYNLIGFKVFSLFQGVYSLIFLSIVWNLFAIVLLNFVSLDLLSPDDINNFKMSLPLSRNPDGTQAPTTYLFEQLLDGTRSIWDLFTMSPLELLAEIFLIFLSMIAYGLFFLLIGFLPYLILRIFVPKSLLHFSNETSPVPPITFIIVMYLFITPIIEILMGHASSTEIVFKVFCGVILSYLGFILYKIDRKKQP